MKKALSITLLVLLSAGLFISCNDDVVGSLFKDDTPVLYTVTFDLNGVDSTTPTSQQIAEGNKVSKPANPTATDYSFGGWYKDTSCTDSEKWNFDTDKVTTDTNLYAKWLQIYTVTFNLNGLGGTAPVTQQIAEGGEVTEPTSPTETGYTFGGWYKDTSFTDSEKWDFDNEEVTTDTNLYAKWTRTLGSIYGTNENVPKAANNTAPDDAWENGNGGKAFIAYSGKTGEGLYLYKQLQPSGAKQLICKKTEEFTKIGDDYVLVYEVQNIPRGVFTLHMTGSTLVSIEYDGTGTDYAELSGTYAPQPE